MLRVWLPTLACRTYLIVDLMFTEVLLQLALSGKDLGAYCALLVLELSITETFRLSVTGIRIWSSTREDTSASLIWCMRLSPDKNSWSRCNTVAVSTSLFNDTGAGLSGNNCLKPKVCIQRVFLYMYFYLFILWWVSHDVYKNIHHVTALSPEFQSSGRCWCGSILRTHTLQVLFITLTYASLPTLSSHDPEKGDEERGERRLLEVLGARKHRCIFLTSLSYILTGRS